MKAHHKDIQEMWEGSLSFPPNLYWNSESSPPKNLTSEALVSNIIDHEGQSHHTDNFHFSDVYEVPVVGKAMCLLQECIQNTQSDRFKRLLQGPVHPKRSSQLIWNSTILDSSLPSEALGLEETWWLFYSWQVPQHRVRILQGHLDGN